MSSRSSSTRDYALAGLSIRSELPLLASMQAPDRSLIPTERISVHYGQVPASLPGPKIFTDAQYHDGSLLIEIPEVARYLVNEGREVVIEPTPSASEGDVRAFFLGTVFGALCHQHGILPLHASAVDIAEGCVVFVGASGAGKSTLAAALAERGHQVISDDVCYLRKDAQGSLMIWPGIPRIRLWANAVEALGYDSSAIERELRGLNKFILPLQPPRYPFRPRRLRGVYQLSPALPGEGPSIETPSGAAMIEHLLPNVYRLTLAEYIGRKSAIFKQCAAIAREVPIYSFRRPLGFDVLAVSIDYLEHHLTNVYA